MLAHLIHLNKKNSEDGGVTPAGVKVRIVEWKIDKGYGSQCVLEEYIHDNFYAKFDTAIIEEKCTIPHILVSVTGAYKVGQLQNLAFTNQK